MIFSRYDNKTAIALHQIQANETQAVETAYLRMSENGTLFALNISAVIVLAGESVGWGNVLATTMAIKVQKLGMSTWVTIAFLYRLKFRKRLTNIARHFWTKSLLPVLRRNDFELAAPSSKTDIEAADESLTPSSWRPFSIVAPFRANNEKHHLKTK